MKKHSDPAIEEVRAARMEVSARYGHDIRKMLADHRELQKQFADRLITLEPLHGRRKAVRRSTKKRAALAA